MKKAIDNGDKSEIPAPDIFYIINDWIEDTVKRDIAMEIEEKNLTETLEVPKTGSFYNGKYYGYPFTWETQAIFYNPNFVKERPNSIEEVFEKAKTIEADNKGVYGFLIPLNGYFTLSFHTMFGGGYDTITDCTSAKSKEVFKKEMRYLKDKLRYKSVNNLELSLFKEGKLAMMVQGTWVLEDLKNIGFDYRISEIPDKRMRPFIGVKSFVVSKKSKYKAESEKIVKYLSSYEVQKEFMKRDSFIPVNKRLFEESSGKYLDAIRESGKKGILMPVSSKIMDYWIKSDKIIDETLNKGNDIDKSVDEILQKR